MRRETKRTTTRIHRRYFALVSVFDKSEIEIEVEVVVAVVAFG